ncbi:S-adenosyl-L-methionine-dependent methyltransferase [Fistulina hepatica ATCC 64428]|nr:S-adenosyl-L-methionine-dependent methyltransferase [Fistulina hepatica ATCC 64428]
MSSSHNKRSTRLAVRPPANSPGSSPPSKRLRRSVSRSSTQASSASPKPHASTSTHAQPDQRSFHVPLGEELDEADGIEVPGESPADDDDDIPIRRLSQFSIFLASSEELVPAEQLHALNTFFLDEAARPHSSAMVASGFVTSVQVDDVSSDVDDDYGLFSDEDDTNSEAPVAAEAVLLRTSDILEINMHHIERMHGALVLDTKIYLRTRFAWYVLGKPAAEYVTLAASLIIPHAVLDFIIEQAMSDGDTNYDDICSFQSLGLAPPLMCEVDIKEDVDVQIYLQTYLPIIAKKAKVSGVPVIQDLLVSEHSKISVKQSAASTTSSIHGPLSSNILCFTPIVDQIKQPFLKRKTVVMGQSSVADLEQLDRAMQATHEHHEDPETIQWGQKLMYEKDTGRQYYESVILDGVKYEIGDTVVVMPGFTDHEIKTISLESFKPINLLAQRMWFIRICSFFEKIKGQQYNRHASYLHGQWFEHGARTFLGEMAHSTSLFLLESCDDIPIGSIFKKIHVSMDIPEEPMDCSQSETEDYHCCYIWNAELQFSALPSPTKVAELLSYLPAHRASLIRKIHRDVDLQELHIEVQYFGHAKHNSQDDDRYLYLHHHCAGGLAEGFMQSGFIETAYAVEYDQSATQTFQKNHPNSHVICGDVNEVLKDIITLADDNDVSCDIDIIAGGPPCQGFSGMNHHRRGDEYDHRVLYPCTLLSFAEVLQPKYFLLENVRGMLDYRLQAQQHGNSMIGGIPQGMIKLILRTLLALNYQAEIKILQSAQYGVPQDRIRIIFLGTRRNLPMVSYPVPTHAFSKPRSHRWDIGISISNISLSPLTRASLYNNLPGFKKDTREWYHAVAPFRPVTINNAIDDLPQFHWTTKASTKHDPPEIIALSTGDHKVPFSGFDSEVPYASNPRSNYQKWLRMSTTEQGVGVTHQWTPPFNWRTIELTRALPIHPNACHEDVPQRNLWPIRALKPTNKKKYFTRADGSKQFHTALTTVDPNSKGSCVVHPSQKRIFTVREIARAQGFPDDYEWLSTKADIASQIKDYYKMIGNAVPVPLALALGREIGKAAYEVERQRAMTTETEL